VTPRRLIAGFALTLITAGCAHLPSDPVADRDDEPASTESDVGQRYEVEGLVMVPAVARTPAPDPAPTEPERPRDLWDRIRDGLQMEVRDNPRIKAELAFYASRPDYLARVADRAEPYLHYIVEELERRGMPMELALLPVVESAFQPFAYSPGQAAGIWQFIPSTGRHYGLKQTWWYDGRRDVVASTNAALNYLQQLYERFSDWELALAAYNCGQGTVARAIRANQQRGRPTDYWNLRLPRETLNYVPRLLAIRALIADPARYELTLRSIPDEPYLTVVEVGSQIDLALAAELAELSVDDMYRLNPGFNRWATDPDGPHLLVVPIETAERFEQALAALPPERRVRWERHKISRGETLTHIADRYRTTVEVLKQVNELRGHIIRAGQHLIVPVASRSAQHYALSAGQRAAQTQEQQRGDHKRIHTVKSGDSLWAIARRYGTSTQHLAAWNGMSPKDTIRPGQNLVVWSKAAPSQPTNADNVVAAKAPADIARPPVQTQQVRYKVRRGDSLYAIARKFNVSIADLRRWNDLAKKTYLQPGQLLMVHVDITGGSI
jgi:membrane-bound lytic murein transglycosylase D